MAFSDLFARSVALIGETALTLRRVTGTAHPPAWGEAPSIPPAKSQGCVPTLKMPTAQGWSGGRTPVAAPGLKVNAFARGLDHPRWIHVLPNGDVLVAEVDERRPAACESCSTTRCAATMKRAAAVGDSANRITLLRDADGDGVAEIRGPFLEGLNQPFGMALLGDTFYVGNTDGVVAFPVHAGRAPASPRPGESSSTSSPAATGRAACCPARTARSCMPASARSATSPTTAWRSRKAAPPSGNSISRPAATASSPAACAMPSAWRGSHHRRAVDRGQRARRPRRRDAARLPDLGA